MKFINCASYGEIKTTYSVESATYAGGFVASTNGKIIIENCQSNAIISSFGAYTAFFIGAAKKDVIVKDCKADVSFKKNEKNSTCIAGCVTGGLYVDGCDVTINNYHFVNGGHYGGMEVLFGTAYGENGVVQIKNMNINLISYKESEVVYFIRQSGNKCRIENINLTTNFDISTLKLVKTTGNTDADGIVVKSKNLLAFYGSDFSGFFVDYRTGKIGLKALSGKGFYQGKVTEEYLLNNGYVKKTV